MNNKVIWFALGGLIGGVAGYFTAKNTAVKKVRENLEKEYDEKFDERIAEIERYYGKTDEYRRVRKEEKKSDIFVKENNTSDLHRAFTESKKAEPVNYSGLYSGKDSGETDPAENEHPEEEDDEDLEALADEEAAMLNYKESLKSGRPPRIVSYEKTEELSEAYDEETLFYYIGNEVLTTENGEVIDDPGLYVGDCLRKYGFDRNDETSIFVQNFNHRIVYEIQKVWSSYTAD